VLLVSACSAVLRFGAGPPHARAHQTHLAVDPGGQVQGIAVRVDLYNPNPLDLAAARFDYRLEAGAAVSEGSVATEAKLDPQRWAPVTLTVPVTPTLRGALEAGHPYVLTGQLVLRGGASGLAVGVSGEGVLADGGGR
jgi:hypothetical protein